MSVCKGLLILLLFSIAIHCSGQVKRQKQSAKRPQEEPLIPVDKAKRLKNIDMIMNMNYNFRNDFRDGEYMGSKFKFEQFRFEIKGYVSEKVYFRFRHRYTSTFEPQSIDKIIKGVDFAYLRIDLSEKTNLYLGKMYADWGGWEFDLNPAMIYEYSDIIEYADNFLSGAQIVHEFWEDNQLSLQVLNSRTGTFEATYDTVPDVKASKIPLATVVTWRGTLFGGKIHTLWSYSLFTEAQGTFKNYIALGQWYEDKKLFLAYDFKISNEDLDRTGVISDEIPDNLYNYSVKNTLYWSHWTRATYKFNSKWHISLDAFVDMADWNDDLDPLKSENRFRTVYSYIPTLEYFPWDDLNLKFFMGFVGRHYKYSDYAKSRPGLDKKDFNTGRLIIGFISPLQIL